MMEKCLDEGLLQAFLDNELTPELSQKVARHIADCDPCAMLLAEVEEETALAFAVLESELNTLVPTQRLWAKINESIETDFRKRSIWQSLLIFVSGLNLLSPTGAAMASLLFVIATFAVLLSIKDNNGPEIANKVPPVNETVLPTKVKVDPPVETPAPEVANNEPPKDYETPPYRVEKADLVEKKEKPVEKTAPKPKDPKNTIVALPQYLPGEESYVNTIANLEKSVNGSKDEVLNPSARFAFEKDLAVVNDAISKLKKEVRKNPKNDAAKQVLFSSYQNKIDLLNSVADRSALMASLPQGKF